MSGTTLDLVIHEIVLRSTRKTGHGGQWEVVSDSQTEIAHSIDKTFLIAKPMRKVAWTKCFAQHHQALQTAPPSAAKPLRPIVIYRLIGYTRLFVHRPFEFWPCLGAQRVESVYVVFVLTCRALCGFRGGKPGAETTPGVPPGSTGRGRERYFR